jgi:tetratricopeptide (TPR) repeat protein
MSYINEALKKAQKQRETNYQKYGGVTSRPAGKWMFLQGRPVLLISVIFVLVSVTFALYYWSDFKSPEITAKAGHKLKKDTTKTAPVSVADPNKIYDKARLFHKNGRLKDAQRMYQEVLRLHPGHVDALNNLGVLFIRDGNFIGARRNFEKAIRLGPGNVDPYYNLACVFAVTGETKKSLTYLKKAVSLDRSVIDWARKDADLQTLQGLPDFKNITGNTE